MASGALAHDYNREVLAKGITGLDHIRHGADIVRNFRYQYYIAAAGQPGAQGDPAGIAPHYFDYHYPMVRLGGGVNSVDSLGGNRQGGIVAESNLSAVKVIIDGFGHADNTQAFLHHSSRGRHGAVAANRYQDIQPERLEIADGLRRTVQIDIFFALKHREVKGIGPIGSSENCPALSQKPRNVLDIKRPVAILDQALIAIQKTNHFDFIIVVGSFDYRSDNSV